MISEIDFSYCPRCKAVFQKKADNLLLCPKCDLHFYINPRPTNAALLHDETGRILLVKRRIDPKKGFWDLPGGFVNSGESLEESLVRELKEELNLTLSEFRYFHSYFGRYEFKGIIYHTLCSVFTGRITSTTVLKPADDVESYQFFAPKDISMEKIAFIEIKDALGDFIGASKGE